MNKFGFAIKTPRSENMDKVSLERYHMLLDREPSFKRCFQCGCCSATCSARFPSGRVRRSGRGIKKVHALRQMHPGMPARGKPQVTHYQYASDP